MSKREYKGHCQCGTIRFSFLSEEIKEGRRCNCSMCVRKGAVLSANYISAADFQGHRDMSQLADYRWGERLLNNLFCKNCGIFPYFGNDEWGYRVNLGCVDELDVLALEIGIIDGRAMPIPEPHATVENSLV